MLQLLQSAQVGVQHLLCQPKKPAQPKRRLMYWGCADGEELQLLMVRSCNGGPRLTSKRKSLSVTCSRRLIAEFSSVGPVCMI